MKLIRQLLYYSCLVSFDSDPWHPFPHATFCLFNLGLGAIQPSPGRLSQKRLSFWVPEWDFWEPTLIPRNELALKDYIYDPGHCVSSHLCQLIGVLAMQGSINISLRSWSTRVLDFFIVPWMYKCLHHIHECDVYLLGIFSGWPERLLWHTSWAQ